MLDARADYARRRSANLRELVGSRYEWMNDCIAPDARGLDVGCGAGLSAEFIKCRRLFLTDFAWQPFLDVAGVDALNLPFSNQAFDFLVATNVIHHLPNPMPFLEEARRVVRLGGYLLMHEPQASVLFCAALRAMRHEGYAFDVDVFDRHAICTDPEDLWAGNNAIARLLFDDHERFARHVIGWQIVRDQPCECVMFLNSGGVTAKTAYLPLPRSLLRPIQRFDSFVAQRAPRLLAVGRRIALRAV